MFKIISNQSYYSDSGRVSLPNLRNKLLRYSLLFSFVTLFPDLLLSFGLYKSSGLIRFLVWTFMTFDACQASSLCCRSSLRSCSSVYPSAIKLSSRGVNFQNSSGFNPSVPYAVFCKSSQSNLVSLSSWFSLSFFYYCLVTTQLLPQPFQQRIGEILLRRSDFQLLQYQDQDLHG